MYNLLIIIIMIIMLGYIQTYRYSTNNEDYINTTKFMGELNCNNIYSCENDCDRDGVRIWVRDIDRVGDIVWENNTLNKKVTGYDKLKENYVKSNIKYDHIYDPYYWDSYSFN